MEFAKSCSNRSPKSSLLLQLHSVHLYQQNKQDCLKRVDNSLGEGDTQDALIMHALNLGQKPVFEHLSNLKAHCIFYGPAHKYKQINENDSYNKAIFLKDARNIRTCRGIYCKYI